MLNANTFFQIFQNYLAFINAFIIHNNQCELLCDMASLSKTDFLKWNENL